MLRCRQAPCVPEGSEELADPPAGGPASPQGPWPCSAYETAPRQPGLHRGLAWAVLLAPGWRRQLLPGLLGIEVGGKIHRVVEHAADHYTVVFGSADQDVPRFMNTPGAQPVAAEPQMPRTDAVPEFRSWPAACPGRVSSNVADRRIEESPVPVASVGT